MRHRQDEPGFAGQCLPQQQVMGAPIHDAVDGEHVPVFGLDDVPGIADFVAAYLKLETSAR